MASLLPKNILTQSTKGVKSSSTLEVKVGDGVNKRKFEVSQKRAKMEEG